MSSCKKWNSCNDKCKRNRSSSKNGGGGNGVIGKDGATGPKGPTGAEGPTGPCCTGPTGIPGTAVNTGATGPQVLPVHHNCWFKCYDSIRPYIKITLLVLVFHFLRIILQHIFNLSLQVQDFIQKLEY